MDVKTTAKALWMYLTDAFEMEEIEAAFEESMEGFGFEPAEIDEDMIENLFDEEARSLLFDIGYMAVNGLFGGDFGTWYDVLEGSLGFDAETIEFFDY